MKKLLISTLIILLFSPLSVLAKTNDKSDIYYTNMNGVQLTEVQYNNLARAFSDDTIYTMSATQINLIKDDTTLKSTSSETYVKVNCYYNYSGELVSKSETDVTKEEYEVFEQPTISLFTAGTYETTMKKITLSITTGALDVKYITINNKWKSIPQVKSYDVIAVRIDTDATLPVIGSQNKGLITGYQKYDGNYVNYDALSSNTKIIWKNSITRIVGRVGISMNILDSVTTSLENEMTVTVNSGATYFTARGTYQHATSDVPLADSQKYTINSSGMGGVINFTDSTVSAKYDQTGGITVTHYYLD